MSNPDEWRVLPTRADCRIQTQIRQSAIDVSPPEALAVKLLRLFAKDRDWYVYKPSIAFTWSVHRALADKSSSAIRKFQKARSVRQRREFGDKQAREQFHIRAPIHANRRRVDTALQITGSRLTFSG